MLSASAFYRTIQNNSVRMREENPDYEKYVSLINILKGFEEYTITPDGTIVSSNLEAVTITGYEEWEAIGKNISIFYSAEDQLAGKPRADLNQTDSRSYYITTGLRVKKKNSTFWAKVRFRTLRVNDNVVGYKMVMQDATHKAVTDHRVKGIRDEYLSLVNNSFVGIFKFSMSDFSIIMMNEKAMRITGLSEEGGTVAGFDSIFENPADFQYMLSQLRRDERVEEWEVRIKCNERWVVISCRYFRQRNFVEGIIVDNTPLKKSNMELNRLKNELDQFIYHASHELRSPLVSMLGIINLINTEKKIDTSISLNAVLKEKVNQLDELLKNITSIAHNNTNPFVPENIEFENLLKSVLKELQPVHNTKVQVFYTVEQERPFFSDIIRLRTILRNMIANSFKYFNPLSNSPWLKIHIRVTEMECAINVEDNGIGIDMNYINNIFKMFYKATEHPKGPGLGLYIVKAMTDTIGGTVDVNSHVGIGTTFQLCIPTAIVG